MPRALVAARALHVGAILLLFGLYPLAPLHPLYLAGVAVVAGLLAWEHTLVRADDLSRVMQAFNLNGWVSLGYFAYSPRRPSGWPEAPRDRGRIHVSVGEILQVRMSVATPTPGAPEKAAVRSMFDRIAPRYDLLNRVLSGGTDVRWRRRAVDRLDLAAPSRVLDLCTGTADLLIEALSRDPGHSGLGIDLSHAMLVRGSGKLARGGYAGRAALAQGDGEHLPVGADLFDGALVAFGIRNVGDPLKAMREVLRVLRPGGRFVVLEFSTPGGLLGRGLPLLLPERAAASRGAGERRRLGLRVPPGLRGEVSGAPGVRLSHAGGGVRRGAVAAAHRRDRVPPPGGEAAMSRLGPALQRAAGWLRPSRDAVLADWTRAVADVRGIAEADAREGCGRELDALLDRLSAGDVEGVLAAEAQRAESEVRRGASLLGIARDLRVLGRCLASVLVSACPDRESLADLVALDELADQRREALLAAQEDESARRLVEAQEQGARAAERAREVQRTNEALRRAEAESRHRAGADRPPLVGGPPDRGHPRARAADAAGRPTRSARA